MKPTYNSQKEYIVDIKNPAIQEKITDGKKTFIDFIKTHKDFNLQNLESVELAYADAQNSGLLEQAADLRSSVFGNNITTYGVSYISDGCFSTCSYCPIRVDAIDVTGDKPHKIKRKTLSVDEFVADTEEIIKDGHSHICFLTGDGMLTYDPRSCSTNPLKLLPYLKAADEIDGVKEIILNITPQTSEGFDMIRSVVKNTSLQFRVFQETYNRNVYADKHARPSKAGKLGPKANYDFRRGSQERAMQAGFDNYGLGVLLGLNPNLLEELSGVVRHKDELTQKFGVSPARICLPTANELKGVNNVEKQNYVPGKANELAYALAKLGMGEVSIVSSERDTPEMLHTLDKYATNRTVDVQPSVGGNLEQAKDVHRLLKQTTVFPTDPESTKKDYSSRGYNLVFDY